MCRLWTNQGELGYCYLDNENHLDKVEADTADSTTSCSNRSEETTAHHISYPVEQETNWKTVIMNV